MKKGKKQAQKAVKAKTKENQFKVSPIGDRVLIKEIPKEDKKTAGGIIIPDTVKDRSTKQGTVVAVGKGKYDDGKLVPMSVSVGDTVLYNWGDEVIVDGIEYILVKESEILAIIK